MERVSSIQQLIKLYDSRGFRFITENYDLSNIPSPEFRFLYREFKRAEENLKEFLEENCKGEVF